MPLSLHLLSLLALIGCVKSYNLDLQSVQMFEDPQANTSDRASYFGYSVALYALGSSSMLLVGAPRANSTMSSGAFIEPGAVYLCSLDSYNGSCVEWPIDVDPPTPIAGQRSNMKSRNYSWLGATISVQNTTRPKVAVCAPRWTNIRVAGSQESWLMNGMCYSVTANDSTSFTRPASRKHTPISNEKMQIIKLTSGQHKGKYVYHQGMGQVGFSMHLTPDIHGNLILGAPGYYYWTGTTVFIDERDQRDPTRAIVPNVIDDTHLEFNDYLGYAVTSGRFYMLSERLYASSAPRSASTMGKVFIHNAPSRYASRFSFRKIVEGEQYGEYFGASLTSCDVNGDGRDDLIVGAPLWSKVSDEGRVYVYMTKGQIEFEVEKIEGEQESARFGTVVQCLNDLDFDGFADLAVGSPYEDNGRGAVYIFNGSPEGLSLREASQCIRAVDLSANLRGFGISISEPRDVDGNRFPDVAIGAYISGHALLLRSRPVVTLKFKLVKSQNFTLMQNSTYFILDLCTFYDGPFAPDTFVVVKVLTIDEVHKRAIVYQNGRLFGNIYRVYSTLRKGEERCTSIKINLKKNIQNVIDPIEIMGNITSYEDSNCSSCPVINPILSKISDNLKLAYILDCGEDDVCNSDLQVKLTSAINDDNSFVIGSNSTYNISIFVENTEEPAYKCQTHVFIPLPITLARIPPECDEKLEVNRTLEVICNVGNPLRFNNTITLELDISAVKYYEESNEIQVAVGTQSEEENLSNNAATLNINYLIDANITIEGKSDGDVYSFEEQDIIDKHFKTVSVNQIYEIWKIGVTPIQETVVIINVPTHWKDEDITIIRKTRISVDGQDHDCDVLLNEELNSTLHDLEFSAEKNSSLIIPPEEHTFFINCTDEHTKCQRLECQLGPLLKNQSLATLTMTIDFRLPNATQEDYKGKDIVYFVSEGFVKVSNFNLTDKLANDLFDYKLLATNFFIRRHPVQVAMWTIIASVLVGIILIVLLAILLIRVGFFKRKHEEEMSALRPTYQLTVVDDD